MYCIYIQDSIETKYIQVYYTWFAVLFSISHDSIHKSHPYIFTLNTSRCIYLYISNSVNGEMCLRNRVKHAFIVLYTSSWIFTKIWCVCVFSNNNSKKDEKKTSVQISIDMVVVAVPNRPNTQITSKQTIYVHVKISNVSKY